MPKLRWGILGTGNIARQFAVGVNASERGVLAGVGSRRKDAAETFAKTHSISHAHGTYEEALRDPTIDAIYVSLPNSMHHAWTIKALQAGKHVLCEKPFAVNLAQAQEMIDAARQAKRLLMEAFMYRSHPQTLAVLDAVRSGQIGELRMIRSSFLFATAKPQGNIRFDASLAGGSLMDIGCYCLSFSRLFAGAEPEAMHAYGHLYPTGVDDYVAGILRFPRDILATFSCGTTVRADNTATILGTTGHIEIPVPWKPPAADAQFTIVNLANERHVRTVSTNKDVYGVEADDFAAAVLDGTPVRVSAEDTLGNQRALDTLRKHIGLPF